MAAQDTKFCLLYWYWERKYNVLSTNTIMKPRREPHEYKFGDEVKAKFQGKKYPAVILGIEDTKDMLRDTVSILEENLAVIEKTATEVMNNMGVNAVIGKDADGQPCLQFSKDDLEVIVVSPDGLAECKPSAFKVDEALQVNVPLKATSIQDTLLPAPSTSTPLVTASEAKSVEETKKKGDSSRTSCRKCRNRCRCDTISTMKKRIEILEKKVLGRVPPEYRHQPISLSVSQSTPPSSAQPSLSTSPSSPQPSLSTSPSSSQPSLSTSPSSAQPSLSTSPSSAQPSLSTSTSSAQPSLSTSPSSAQPSLSTPSSVQASLSTPPSISSMLQSLQNVSKTDTAATAKKLATSLFTDDEMCKSSISGKRSHQSSGGTRDALDTSKIQLMEQVAIMHLINYNRKDFIEKLQNVQKCPRRKEKDIKK